jgi:hypothetical protein
VLAALFPGACLVSFAIPLIATVSVPAVAITTVRLLIISAQISSEVLLKAFVWSARAGLRGAGTCGIGLGGTWYTPAAGPTSGPRSLPTAILPFGCRDKRGAASRQTCTCKPGALESSVIPPPPPRCAAGAWCREFGISDDDALRRRALRHHQPRPGQCAFATTGRS